jgi:hypothetical protein
MPLVGTGINPYDLSTKCKADPICYVESESVFHKRRHTQSLMLVVQSYHCSPQLGLHPEAYTN